MSLTSTSNSREASASSASRGPAAHADDIEVVGEHRGEDLAHVRLVVCIKERRDLRNAGGGSVRNSYVRRVTPGS